MELVENDQVETHLAWLAKTLPATTIDKLQQTIRQVVEGEEGYGRIVIEVRNRRVTMVTAEISYKVD